MKTCTVCKHPRRAEIDEALIAGGDNARIGKAFGPSRDAIRRHATHVLAIVKKYDETTALARGGDLKAKMLLREDDLLRLREKAEADHDIPTAIAAIRELRQFHELQARMEGHDSRTPLFGAARVLAVPSSESEHFRDGPDGDWIRVLSLWHNGDRGTLTFPGVESTSPAGTAAIPMSGTWSGVPWRPSR